MAKPSAKRYALALYQMAQEKSLVEKWHEQLKSCEAILENDDFSGFLLMPKVQLLTCTVELLSMFNPPPLVAMSRLSR